MCYLTGQTALNIPREDGCSADWHSTALVNRKNWILAGVQLDSTDHLLGDEGVYDATLILRRYAPDTPDGVFAASYERAVFDLLVHFSMRDKPVPNIQWKDIDNSVNSNLVKAWIETVDLPRDQKSMMLDWFRYSELPVSFGEIKGSSR